jgi:hypothetical protein
MIETTRSRKGLFSIFHKNSLTTTADTSTIERTLPDAPMASALVLFMSQLAKEFPIGQVPALLVALMEHVILETKYKHEKHIKE